MNQSIYELTSWIDNRSIVDMILVQYPVWLVDHLKVIAQNFDTLSAGTYFANTGLWSSIQYWLNANFSLCLWKKNRFFHLNFEVPVKKFYFLILNYRWLANTTSVLELKTFHWWQELCSNGYTWLMWSTAKSCTTHRLTTDWNCWRRMLWGWRVFTGWSFSLFFNWKIVKLTLKNISLITFKI